MCWIDVATLVSETVGNLAAGVPLTLLAGLVAWVVGRRLDVFEQAKERKGRQRRETRRALDWLRLLRGEVPDLVDKIPQWRGALKSVEWGKVFNIGTPIWELAERSGELARLGDPQVLRKLGLFYHWLGRTKEWVPLIAQSWMVPESLVVSAGPKRDALIAMAVQGLDQAGKAGDGLVAMLDSEIERLTKRLEALGGGVSADAQRPEDEGGEV